MTETNRTVLFVVLGLVAIAITIVGGTTYYYIHRPAIEQCKDACGYNMFKSFDSQTGCACR